MNLETNPKENTTSLLFTGLCLATGDVFIINSLRTDPKENTTSLLFTGSCVARGDMYDFY
jgi:hypothetical protein